MSFFEIVGSADLERISQAIAEGAEVNELEPCTGNTPLMLVCRQNGEKTLEILSALIDAGADVNHVRKSDKMTPLKLASLHCSGACVERLLAAGADLEGPPSSKETPLFLASRANNYDAVMVLIGHGADLGMGGAIGGDAVRAAEDAYTQRPRESDDAPHQDFSDLLDALSTRLATDRPQFLLGLNPPATQKQLEAFEHSTGLKLPEEYRQLLGWRNGQPDDCFEDFHPFSGEMFMSLASIEATIATMIELLDTGDIDERHWHRDWLPILADGSGNHTCIDLSTEGNGRIINFDHEVGFAGIAQGNLSAWLEELLAKLQYLDVEAWEKEQSR